MKNVEDRLKELLDQKDEVIVELQSEVAKLQRELRYGSSWTRHIYKNNNEKELPVPRIELSVDKSDRDLTVLSANLIISQYIHTDSDLIIVPLSYSERSIDFKNCEEVDSSDVQWLLRGSSVTACAVGQSEKMNLPLVHRYDGNVIDGINWD